MKLNAVHQPVLLKESLEGLTVQPGQWYIDCTFGRGGHTNRILKLGGKVIALDCDQTAIEYGQKRYSQQLTDGNLILVWSNFDNLEEAMDKLQEEQPLTSVRGVLYDFGTSVEQLMSEQRGFSFTGSGPLDMRMDKRMAVQAKDLLAMLSEKQLGELFKEYGGETQARAIAAAIKASPKPVVSSADLVDIITQVKGKQRGKLHPATKVFQALRMAVNSEPDRIKDSLPQAFSQIKAGGRIVTISFHEGEDRLVKHQFVAWQKSGVGRILTKKPITPSILEVKNNPRSRSAKLRVLEKI